MNTLLLRLAGPMQSWGTQSRFFTRDTGLEPSKSGVIGLLCAALGWGRETSLEELAGLRMGVRVDRAGVMKMDYQTAGGGTLPDGSPYGVRRASDTRGETVLSDRYYLADADFLVGLESDDAGLLHRIEEALKRPVWQIYLGRKAFVPSVPVHIPGGFRPDEDLETALRQHPWPRADLDVPSLTLAARTAASDTGEPQRVGRAHGPARGGILHHTEFSAPTGGEQVPETGDG